MIRLIVRLALMLALLALSACSTIKQWFPDKEKDYQHTTEIPELVLPPDLIKRQAPMSPSMVAPAAPEPVAAVAPDPGEPDRQSARTTVERQDETPPDRLTGFAPSEPSPPEDELSGPVNAGEEPALSRTVSYQVEKLTADGENGLRIHAPINHAWRAVEKALGRKSIEVSDRDEQEKQFAVRYDPDEHGIKDSSFWDEVNFFLYGLKGNEKAYFITLLDGGQWTDLRVLDEESKPAQDAGAAELIRLLEETIRSDFDR